MNDKSIKKQINIRQQNINTIQDNTIQYNTTQYNKIIPETDCQVMLRCLEEF